MYGRNMMKGNLAGHDAIQGHPGHYSGGAEDKTDFGGSGWKIRLDPENDRDNYIISHWIKQNKDRISSYKLAWTSGDHPVWTLYTGTGSAKDAQYLAQKAEKEIGKFLRTGQVFQSEDTLLPGTKLSGRFEIRGDERSFDSKKHKEIVDEIEKLRPSHNPMKGLYLRFKASPMYKKGFPTTTSGKSGVPGTAYYAWLQGNIGTVNYPPAKASGLVNHRSNLHSVYYKPIDTWLVPQQLAVEEAYFVFFVKADCFSCALRLFTFLLKVPTPTNLDIR